MVSPMVWGTAALAGTRTCSGVSLAAILT